MKRIKVKNMKVVWMLLFALSVNQVVAQDPLQDYLTLAAQQNPGLQAKYAAFEAILEKVAATSGLPDPNLSFGYFIQPVETRVGPQRMKFSLSQMFPWFGSLSAKGDAMAASAQASYWVFIDAREKLLAELKTDYYKLWELQRLIDLETENLEILKNYQELTTTKVSNGEGKLSDAYRVQMEIEQATTQIKVLQDQLPTLQRVFNRKLNRQVTETVILMDTILVNDLTIASTDSFSHPSVVKYKELQRSALFQEKASQKSGLPKIGAGIDYVLVDERTDMAVPDNGKDVLMPMVSISLPIWRKQYSSAIKSAQLQQKQFELEAQNGWDALESSRDMQLYKVQQATDEMKMYDEELALVSKTLELLITDYTNGREGFEEVLRLQQRTIQYRKLKLKSYLNYLESMANMEYFNYSINKD